MKNQISFSKEEIAKIDSAVDLLVKSIKKTERKLTQTIKSMDKTLGALRKNKHEYSK